MPTEIECYRCRITKPLNAFTKTQRLDWSSAVCSSCLLFHNSDHMLMFKFVKTCKTCTAYYMSSETWEEERENAIAMGIDGYTETGSTIDEVSRSYTWGLHTMLIQTRASMVESHSNHSDRFRSRQSRLATAIFNSRKIVSWKPAYGSRMPLLMMLMMTRLLLSARHPAQLPDSLGGTCLP